jgi:peptidoglycan/LPS O-acetylase OafA/YrhL
MASALVCTEVVPQSKVDISSAPAFQFEYTPSLDGLRALAVLAVMAYHRYTSLFGGGQVGVDVFFVLSGFLITGLLLKEWTLASSIDLKSFYCRRALRLLPALLAVLSLSEAYACFYPYTMSFWTLQKSIVAALLYSANWMRVVDKSSMGALSHTWSLSVEEQFYFLWPPILLMLLARLRKAAIVPVLVVAILLVGFHRFTLWSGENSWHRIYNGTDTRLDELLAGCAAAFALNLGWLRNRTALRTMRCLAPISALFLGGLVVKPMSHHVMCLAGWIGIEIAGGVVICWLVTCSKGFAHRILESQPLVWIGKISYGLYLWHFPIFWKLEGMNIPNGLKSCLMFTTAFAVAALSYHFVERPFLRLKSRMTPRSTCVSSTPKQATCATTHCHV